MSTAEALTRATIWIFILGYVVAAAFLAFSGTKRKSTQIARLALTAAVLSLLAHVAFAFHFYHSWSHQEAYQDTARQTYETVGWNWGGGLYVNYVLLIGLLTDVGWWWLRGIESYRRRPWLLVASWHGFMIFIIFNATVVFETGWVRWVGIFASLSLCMLWWHAGKNTSNRNSRT